MAISSVKRILYFFRRRTSCLIPCPSFFRRLTPASLRLIGGSAKTYSARSPVRPVVDRWAASAIRSSVSPLNEKPRPRWVLNPAGGDKQRLELGLEDLPNVPPPPSKSASSRMVGVEFVNGDGPREGDGVGAREKEQGVVERDMFFRMAL